MCFEAPIFDAPSPADIAAALVVRRDLHAARARLVQRNVGAGCDVNDAKRVRDLEARFEEHDLLTRQAAEIRFREEHGCQVLARCQMGRAR